MPRPVPNVASAPKSWIRPKRRLSALAWKVLTAIAATAAAILVAKLLGPRLFGWTWLADTFTLAHLAPPLKERLGHLFIVPIGALVVAIFRLTLNLRTLGPFRAILLAMAFESVGYGLGLAFFVLVTSAVMVLRPATRSMGLPYYGRVLTIVSVASAIVVMVLIAASALGRVDLTRVAYFPIVVLALTGDTSSRILASEGLTVLLRRFAVTLLAGATIAGVVGIDLVREALIAHPELIAFQIIGVVLVSELFDIRLLGPADAAPSKRTKKSARPVALAQALSFDPLAPGPLRVAVVRNRSKEGILGRVGGRRVRSRYSRKAIQRVLEALRSVGLEARAFEGDCSLPAALASYFPIDPQSKRVHGIVLNLADGIQGSMPGSHVPALLELAGVPYTGAGPRGRMLDADLAAMRQALAAAGIPTPSWTLLRTTDDPIGDLEFPLVVRPRDPHARRSPRVVTNTAELEVAVRAVVERSGCDALVESHVVGRTLTLSLVGSDPMRPLPITEFAHRVSTGADGTVSSRPVRICPARLDPDLERRVRTIAVAACAACGLRELAKIDVCIDGSGEPHVMQVHAAPPLGWAGTTVRSARRGGYTFAELLLEIIHSAGTRAGLPVTRGDVRSVSGG